MIEQAEARLSEPLKASISSSQSAYVNGSKPHVNGFDGDAGDKASDMMSDKLSLSSTQKVSKFYSQ